MSSDKLSHIEAVLPAVVDLAPQRQHGARLLVRAAAAEGRQDPHGARHDVFRTLPVFQRQRSRRKNLQHVMAENLLM